MRPGPGDPNGRGRSPGLVGRAVWSFVGQTASSASNFLLSILVLAVAPSSEFAVFALSLTTYALLLQLTRATIGVPITLFHSDSAGSGDAAEQRAAVGASVSVGALAGVAIMASSAFTPAGRAQLLILGVSLPLLLWQDSIRYVCFARSAPSTAALADLIWIGVQIVASAVLFLLGRASAVTLLVAWAGGGIVSACTMGIRLHLAPGLGAAARWFLVHRALIWRLLAEFVVAAGSHYSVYYGLAIVSGAGQFGRLKAAQTLLGPVVVLLQSGGLLGVPESVRAAHDPRLLRGIAVRLSLVLAGGSLACGIVTYACLPALGPHLFPHAWAAARPLLPWLTAFCMALGVSTAVTGGIRALGGTPWLLRVRAWSGVLLVALGLAASVGFQAAGALFSVTVVEVAVTILAWRRLLDMTASPTTTIREDDHGRTDLDSPGRLVLGTAEAGVDPLWP